MIKDAEVDLERAKSDAQRARDDLQQLKQKLREQQHLDAKGNDGS
jgi:FtsZ-binding cell division protein ZapB